MPGGDFHPVLFFIIAFWILACALGVVLFKKIVYSAVSMIFCFLGVAFAYALLNAALVAIIQILVYVGAISIVVMFAIMLTEAQEGRYPLFFNRQAVFAAPLVVAGAAIVAAALVSSGIDGTGEVSLNLEPRRAVHASLQGLRAALRARLAGAAGGDGRRDPAGAARGG